MQMLGVWSSVAAIKVVFCSELADILYFTFFCFFVSTPKIIGNGTAIEKVGVNGVMLRTIYSITVDLSR